MELTRTALLIAFIASFLCEGNDAHAHFKLTAKLNLWGNRSNSGYLGNQMFIFQSTIGIALAHGMQSVFARGQCQLLNEIFDLSPIIRNESNAFNVEFVEGHSEPDFPLRDVDHLDALSVTFHGDTKLGHYLQNAKYMNFHPRQLYTLRKQHLDAARKLITHRPCIAMHLRYFPEGHLSHGSNKCPSSASLLNVIGRVASDGACIYIFSNDVERAQNALSGMVERCIHYVNPGAVETVSDSKEIRPTNVANLARDFAALTMCRDLILTCGTFGSSAAMLHSGSGRVFYWRDDPGTMKAYPNDCVFFKRWIPYA